MKPGRILYRTSQFWLAWQPRPHLAEVDLARRWLNPAQFALFNSLPPAEKAHGLRVCARLTAGGQSDPDLLAAALLHDCGKSRSPLNPFERALIVLIQGLLPRLAQRLGRGELAACRSRLRRIFIVAEQHPAWSGELMRRAGATPRAARLAAAHQADQPAGLDAAEMHLLRLLQAADNHT